MAQYYDLGISPWGAFKAGEDMSAKQYYFVELQVDKADQVWIANGGSTTYSPIGVLQNAPSTNGEAAVMIFGMTKVVAAYGGGATSPGSWITINGSGQAYLTTCASRAVGIALEHSDSSASCIIAAVISPFMSWLTHGST